MTSITVTGVDGLPEVVEVDGTVYRYFFSGALAEGEYTIEFNEGSWTDNAGNYNLAETERFYVVEAKASYKAAAEGIPGVLTKTHFPARAKRRDTETPKPEVSARELAQLTHFVRNSSPPMKTWTA